MCSFVEALCSPQYAPNSSIKSRPNSQSCQAFVPADLSLSALFARINPASTSKPPGGVLDRFTIASRFASQTERLRTQALQNRVGPRVAGSSRVHGSRAQKVSRLCLCPSHRARRCLGGGRCGAGHRSVGRSRDLRGSEWGVLFFGRGRCKRVYTTSHQHGSGWHLLALRFSSESRGRFSHCRSTHCRIKQCRRSQDTEGRKARLGMYTGTGG